MKKIYIMRLFFLVHMAQPYCSGIELTQNDRPDNDLHPNLLLHDPTKMCDDCKQPSREEKTSGGGKQRHKQRYSERKKSRNSCCAAEREQPFANQ